MTLTAPTGRSPANSGTQMWERSPTSFCSWAFRRGSFSAYSMSSGSRAAMANREMLWFRGRRLCRKRTAIPEAARVTTSSPSIRWIMAPSARVSAWARSTITCITCSRSPEAAAAISRWVEMIRSRRVAFSWRANSASFAWVTSSIIAIATWSESGAPASVHTLTRHQMTSPSRRT